MIQRLKDWWYLTFLGQQKVFDYLTNISLQQQAILNEQDRRFGELWLRLAQWWQQEYINIKPPAEWPIVGEIGMIECPICQTAYKIDHIVPASAKRATVVCSNSGCGEAMEVYPDSYYGWIKPRVEYRERSFK